MAHQQQGAVEVQQALLEQFQGLQVEIVGRLVHHQQVEGTGEQARQQQAVALAARQCPHRLACPRRREQEIGEIGDHVLLAPVDHHLVAAAGDVVLHRAVQVELLAQLVEIGDLQAGAQAYLPAVGLQATKHQLEQGALAATVGTDDAHPVATQDSRAEATDHRSPVPGVVHVFQLAHQAPGTFGAVERDPRRALTFAPRPRLLAQDLQAAHPSLVAGTARLDALANPGLLLRQQTLLARALLCFGAVQCLATPQIGVVVAGKVAQAAPVQFHDARSQPPQEAPVVGDEDQGAAPAEQEFLQPGNGLDVEVVGRLVEQQQLRITRQRTRQQHAPLHAA